mmetsp:Transcript_3188/g.8810  ORF Transcript_3188/g.8810 Transcript_3188/m.8810 type:complete len:243 (-) Transcript_3188:3376-4104(-)
MGSKDFNVLELLDKGPAGCGPLSKAQRGSARCVDPENRVSQLAGQDGRSLHSVRRGHQDAPGGSRYVEWQDLDGDLCRTRGGLDGIFRGFGDHKGQVPQSTAVDRQRVVGDLGLDDEVPVEKMLDNDNVGERGRSGTRRSGLEGFRRVEGFPEVHGTELGNHIQIGLRLELGIRQLVFESRVLGAQERGDHPESSCLRLAVHQCRNQKGTRNGRDRKVVGKKPEGSRSVDFAPPHGQNLDGR